MARPDLSDPKQRRAYQAELRRVYWPWRAGSVALVIIAIIGWLFDPLHDLLWVALLIIGAVIVIGVIVARTRYHRARMSQGHQV